MTLEEFYRQTGGSYEDMLELMGREDLIRRFLGIFRSGQQFEKLTDAMNRGDDAAAFDAIHTLKGNALNVGLGDLGRSASALTEALRYGKTPEADDLYRKVREDYETAIHGLDALE